MHTKEQIDKWTREAGIRFGSTGVTAAFREEIAKLAELVAKAERERCAQLCDDMALYTGVDCAAAIRKEPT